VSIVTRDAAAKALAAARPHAWRNALALAKRGDPTLLARLVRHAAPPELRDEVYFAICAAPWLKTNGRPRKRTRVLDEAVAAQYLLLRAGLISHDGRPPRKLPLAVIDDHLMNRYGIQRSTFFAILKDAGIVRKGRGVSKP
jgi:hypothetical protein